MLRYHRGEPCRVGALHLITRPSALRDRPRVKAGFRTDLADNFASLDDDECRHRRDSILLSDGLDLVDINFQELGMCELLEMVSLGIMECVVIRCGNAVPFVTIAGMWERSCGYCRGYRCQHSLLTSNSPYSPWSAPYCVEVCQRDKGSALLLMLYLPSNLTNNTCLGGRQGLDNAFEIW